MMPSMLSLRSAPVFSPSISLLKISLTPIIQLTTHRTFTNTPTFKMPQPLKAEDINSKTDPSVSTQWDDKTPKKQQIEEFYKTVDGMKIGLLTTIRSGIGPVSRSMAVSKVRCSA